MLWVFKFSFVIIGERIFLRGVLNRDMILECDRFFMNNNLFCDLRIVIMGFYIVICII